MKANQIGFLFWIAAVGWVAGLFLAVPQAQGEAEPVRGVTSRVAAPSSPVSIYLPLVIKLGSSVVTAPLWRFGIGQVRRSLQAYAPTDIAAMRFGWYMDWGASPSAPRPYGMEYVPLVRVKQWKLQNDSTWTTWCVDCPYVTTATGYTYTVSPDWNQIRALATANPGLLWLLGNEIERRDWYVGRQDEILPELYAQAYHDLYQAIKDADPLAQVAIGGVIQATPLRLEYLSRVWNAYQTTYSQTMPVDVWNIHAFVLQEKSCVAYPADCWGAEIPAGLDAPSGQLYTMLDGRNFAKAKAQLIAMRTWMKARALDRPLIVSEYGVPFPDWVSTGSFTPEIVRDRYMFPSFDYFLNQPDPALGYSADGYRMVQRWMWYSLDDDNEYSNGEAKYNGNLFYSGFASHPQGVAPLGTYWKQYAQALPPGAVPPYTMSLTSAIEFRAVEQPAEPSVPSDCGLQRRVRLLFYEPAQPGSSSGSQRFAPPPRLMQESAICVERAPQ